jgi:6-pyruvoyltetrahydropterin/6-carboxytetrahydropterin synthase
MKNQTIRITKEFGFEMAHALDFHQGKCKNIHGHSYKLSVTLKGKPKHDSSSENGMIIDFYDLKILINQSIVDIFDHALVLHKDSPYAQLIQQDLKLILVDYQPTCELMLLDFVQRIKKVLPKNIQLHHLTLRETATSFAEWHQEDN